jgi:hypothetical protein
MLRFGDSCHRRKYEPMNTIYNFFSPPAEDNKNDGYRLFLLVSNLTKEWKISDLDNISESIFCGPRYANMLPTWECGAVYSRSGRKTPIAKKDAVRDSDAP